MFHLVCTQDSSRPLRHGTKFVASSVLVLGLHLSAGAQSGCDWSSVSNIPVARLEAPTEVIDNRMLVFGGFDVALNGLKRVDAYDPASDTWSSLADMPLGLTHAGWAVDNRDVWMAGGFIGAHPGPVTDQVWSYNVDTNVWTQRVSLPALRGSGGLFRLGTQLHYVGGVAADRDTDEDEHWVLDLTNPTAWQLAAPLPIARNHFGTYVLNGRAYLFGGQFKHDTNPTDTALVHVFDSVSGWKQAASMPFPRSHFEPTIFASGDKIVISGGRANTLGLDSVQDMSAYDTTNDGWFLYGLLPKALLAPSMELVGNELVLTAGGSNPSNLFDTTYRFPAWSSSSYHLRLNCGGPALNLPATWCVDFGFNGGTSSSNSNLGDISGTTDDELYKTERAASNSQPNQFSYTLPVASGLYRVTLHFAEIYFGTAASGFQGGVGSRVFDVSIEGQLVLDDLDIFANVGPAAALVRTFDVAISDGALNLSFVSSADRPKVSGIELMALGAGGNYCTTTPNSVGAGAKMGWQGSLSMAANQTSILTSALPPAELGIFLMSQAKNGIPLGVGTLCVKAPIKRLAPVVQTSASGTAARVLDFTNPAAPEAAITAGSTWNFQIWYRDSGNGATNLSDGLSLPFTP